MNESTSRPHDAVLLPFLGASDEAESERILEGLICDHALPLIRDIVSFKLRSCSSIADQRDSQELDDLCGDIVVKLVRKLRQSRSAPDEPGITSLRGYVAAMAYNESDGYLRRKYPQRSSLKNKLRYALTRQPGFAVWEDEAGRTVCGRKTWQGRSISTAVQSQRRLENLNQFVEEKLAGVDVTRVAAPALLTALFEFTRGPVELDKLVTVVSELWGVRENPTHTENLASVETESRRHAHVESENSIDHRDLIERAWREIVDLPIRQRVALLLNLRDEHGDAAITLLPALRVATVRQIADVLEMPADELAELWDELPIEDSVLAGRLGVTRQQVVNLRKCARERLSRRLRGG